MVRALELELTENSGCKLVSCEANQVASPVEAISIT